MEECRILALDGGGIRGVYSAAVLDELENRTHAHVQDYFHLITGTSTGGIIALALGMGMRPSQILKFYKEKGPTIFPPPGFLGKVGQLIDHFLWTKYSNEDLGDALKSVFHDTKLGQSGSRLVITAYNGKRNDLYLFKTRHHRDHTHHYEIPAVEVAMATSSAPTYFEAVNLKKYDKEAENLRDGGICANCPVLVGIVEAMRYLETSLENISVLSIGTMYDRFNVGGSKKFGGILQWNMGLVHVFMHGQQAGAVTLAEALLNERMIRVTKKKEGVSLDDTKQVSALEEWGRQALDEPPEDGRKTPFERIKDQELFVSPIQPFRPLN